MTQPPLRRQESLTAWRGAQALSGRVDTCTEATPVRRPFEDFIRGGTKMIPSKSHPKWVPLLRGDTKLQFKVFAGNMMLSQCARKLKSDASPQTVQACIDEAHAFFSKYENLYKAELQAHF
ncbi:hypothetical protein HDC36_001978 [Xanthomonas sp. JAI131]|uniref:hypothetical protein n=1 Tax=Xanthomonas TaxID=338 RepID=UPI0017E589F6|nr:MULTISPECIES: hypothetical protein [Xanthomonas]NYF20517.1 hypothetical protein [Xanthomonas sp. JAI131]